MGVLFSDNASLVWVKFERTIFRRLHERSNGILLHRWHALAEGQPYDPAGRIDTQGTLFQKKKKNMCEVVNNIIEYRASKIQGSLHS